MDLKLYYLQSLEIRYALCCLESFDVILKIYWVVQKDKIFLLSFMIILFIINGDTIQKSPIDLLN